MTLVTFAEPVAYCEPGLIHSFCMIDNTLSTCLLALHDLMQCTWMVILACIDVVHYFCVIQPVYRWNMDHNQSSYM